MDIYHEIAKTLLKKGLKMSTAESCTGGRIACRITELPGSSAYYVGSVVSYSNEVKESILNVSAIDIEIHGAVSQPVVEQMAYGAMEATGSDCAVATSGIAGPGGATDEKPVGTVWIAAAVNDSVFSECYHFKGNRQENMDEACDKALEMLLTLLKK